MISNIETKETQTFPTPIEKDMRIENLAKKIWTGCVIAFAIALTVSVIYAFTAVIAISAIALSILLICECARRFSKKPGIVAGIDYEIFSIFGAAMTYFKGNKNPEYNGKEPILLVHGYLHNRSGWHLFKKRLKKEGVDNPLYTISLGSPFHSIEEFSEKVQKRIDEIKEKTGAKTVKLIGHSMGGIVSAHAENESVSQVITLGSPLQGTKLAYIGVGKCAKQMRRNSPLLAELGEKIQKSDKYTHFGSGGDIVILPHDSANPGGKGKKFPSIGHLSMLYSEQVAHETANILKVR